MRLKLNIDSGIVDLVNNYGKEISSSALPLFLFISCPYPGENREDHRIGIHRLLCIHACAIRTFKLYLIALKNLL